MAPNPFLDFTIGVQTSEPHQEENLRLVENQEELLDDFQPPTIEEVIDSLMPLKVTVWKKAMHKILSKVKSAFKYVKLY